MAAMTAELARLDRQVLSLFSTSVRSGLLEHFTTHLDSVSAVQEIRLRKGRPICIVAPGGDCLLLSSVSQDDIDKTLSLITDCSYYALENELANGYITIPGGHRVGLSGQAATWADGSIRIREVSGFCFRIAREVKGTAEKVIRHLMGPQPSGRLASTLIISPPGCGKTTLLRDLCRLAGEGAPQVGLRPSQVGIVDERSEIAACHRGVPQHDVGPRADILDRCPKARGMMMLQRSMGPDVIATDEIGSEEDARAVAAVLSGGASVLATCHGENLLQVKRQPHSAWLIDKGYFQKAVVLSRRRGPGTVEYAGEINGGCPKA